MEEEKLKDIILKKDFSGFKDFLNEKDYGCEVPSHMCGKMLAVLSEALDGGRDISSFSRDRVMAVLDFSYKEIDSLIPYKESSLFEENFFYVEDFIAKNVLNPFLEDRAGCAVTALYDIDSSVMSPALKSEYKSRMMTSLSFSSDPCRKVFGGKWNKDMLDVFSSFKSMDYSLASHVIYANAQADTGITSPEDLTAMLKRAGRLFTERLDDTFSQAPGCDIGEDLNLKPGPETEKRIKEAALCLLGKDVPGRYSSEAGRDEEVLDFFKKLSFGYDGTTVSSFQLLVRTLASEFLSLCVCDSTLERKLEDGLGYKSEVFKADNIFALKVFRTKRYDFEKAFMNDRKLFLTGEEKVTEWPVELLRHLSEAYGENFSRFSRKDLNDTLDYVMNTPSHFISDERAGKELSPEDSVFTSSEKTDIMKCLIDNSVSYGCSPQKTERTFASFVNLKSFRVEASLKKEQEERLSQVLKTLSKDNYFSTEGSASLADYACFTHFASDVLSGKISDVDISLMPYMQKRKEKEERDDPVL